ncbi:MAG: hypothetical protein ACHQ01_09450 [Candidatus Limnocylindrales bacterium]
MGSATRPRIAHGIAQFHPDQDDPPSGWRWGPEWSLPMDRTGRWACETSSYDPVAVRVEFVESGAGGPMELGKRDQWRNPYTELLRARDALSVEEVERLEEWLGWADKRAAAEFTSRWTARVRRERGQVPAFTPGIYIRDRLMSSGVWHVASGRTWDNHGAPDRILVGTECGGGEIRVDLGETDLQPIPQSTNPDRVCKRCLARVAGRASGAETARETVAA